MDGCDLKALVYEDCWNEKGHVSVAFFVGAAFAT